MARAEARIYTRIWDPEDDFIALDAGPQRLYLLLISQPGLSLCGVIDYTPKRWATLAANTTVRAITKDLDALAVAHKIVIDPVSEELWIRSYLKNDPGVFKSANLVVGVANAYVAVSSGVIRRGLAEQIAKGIAEGLPEGLPEGLSERLPDPFLKVLHDGFDQGSNARTRTRSSSSSTPSTTATSSPSSSGSRGADLALSSSPRNGTRQDDDDGGDQLVIGAFIAIARPMLEQRNAEMRARGVPDEQLIPLGNRRRVEAWVRSTAANELAVFEPLARTHLADDPTLTSELLAERLRPELFADDADFETWLPGDFGPDDDPTRHLPAEAWDAG